jgi:hypothetical protein
MLVVVISPLAKIILAGVSPTENPATELNALIAIVFFPLLDARICLGTCIFIYRFR